ELFEEAAVAHAGGLAEEVERHVGADCDVAPDADEVDVDEVAPGVVALDLAGQREHGLAVELEVDQGVGAGLARQDVGELPRRDADLERLVAEAVDDGRDLALAAQPARGPGTPFGARNSSEDDVRHGRKYYRLSPWKISLTLVSLNTARRASATIPAIESTVSAAKCFSDGTGSVLVTA